MVNLHRQDPFKEAVRLEDIILKVPQFLDFSVDNVGFFVDFGQCLHLQFDISEPLCVELERFTDDLVLRRGFQVDLFLHCLYELDLLV